MTRDDLIRYADMVGYDVDDDDDVHAPAAGRYGLDPRLVQFAELVSNATTMRQKARYYQDGYEADKHEPVAWMRNDGTLLFADGNVFAVGQAFYTAPPKREWVGLTDEEEIELDEKYGDDINAYIDARDAKLKERNNG